MIDTESAVALTPLPAILDIEASGFGTGSYPIEVGFVLPDGHSWCSLIQPQADWRHWDPVAEAVHRISPQQLRRHGRAAREVATTLNERLRGLTVYSDGWAHDYAWLNCLYEAAELTPSFKLDNLRALLTESEAERWHEVKVRVAVKMGPQRHRASADARLLQQTLAALRSPFPAAA